MNVCEVCEGMFEGDVCPCSFGEPPAVVGIRGPMIYMRESAYEPPPVNDASRVFPEAWLRRNLAAPLPDYEQLEVRLAAHLDVEKARKKYWRDAQRQLDPKVGAFAARYGYAESPLRTLWRTLEEQRIIADAAYGTTAMIQAGKSMEPSAVFTDPPYLTRHNADTLIDYKTQGPHLPFGPRFPPSDFASAIAWAADGVLRRHTEARTRSPFARYPRTVIVGETIQAGDEYRTSEGYWRMASCSIGMKVPPSAKGRFRRPIEPHEPIPPPHDPYMKAQFAQVELGLDEELSIDAEPKPYEPQIQIQHGSAPDL